jgi:hypothetical protein
MGTPLAVLLVPHSYTRLSYNVMDPWESGPVGKEVVEGIRCENGQ